MWGLYQSHGRVGGRCSGKGESSDVVRSMGDGSDPFEQRTMPRARDKPWGPVSPFAVTVWSRGGGAMGRQARRLGGLPVSVLAGALALVGALDWAGQVRAQSEL